MRTLYLRINDNGSLVTKLALECRKRKCDYCSLRFQCYTKKFPSISKRTKIVNDCIDVELNWVFANLEYRADGVCLVWKTSKVAQKQGAFIRSYLRMWKRKK